MGTELLITFLVGLPGSGKTYLGKSLELHDAVYLDDFSNQPDAISLLKSLIGVKHIIISDVSLCIEQERLNAINKINSIFKGYKYKFEWIYFENDPEKCLENVAFRNKLGDLRTVDECIKTYTKLYTIPDNVIPRQIWQNQMLPNTYVKKFIQDNNLEANIVEIEPDGDHCQITIEVSRKDYERANNLIRHFYDDSIFISILVKQKTPELIPASLGDFVLIYSEHTAQDSESDVGIVSSVFDENGQISYGCRYIKIGLGNSFVSRYDDIEITTEEYGGHPKGFIKILTPEEIIQHLQFTLSKNMEKELNRINQQFENTKNHIPEFITAITNLQKTITCEKITLPEFRSNIRVKQ